MAIEGKPLQWLNQIQDRNLHLVPVDYAKPLQEEYLPSKLSSADYPNLIAELLARGHSEAEIAKILGGNLQRVWREAGQVAAQLQRGAGAPR